jgi:hypothetical protein
MDARGIYFGTPYLVVQHLGRAPRPRGAARSHALARGMYLSRCGIDSASGLPATFVAAPRMVFRRPKDRAPYRNAIP